MAMGAGIGVVLTIFIILVIGAVAGWLAGKIMKATASGSGRTPGWASSAR